MTIRREWSEFMLDRPLLSAAKLLSKKVRVEISVLFLKIGEIDTIKESYEADVMITAKWREPALDKGIQDVQTPIDWSKYWNPKLFVENVVGDPKENAHQMLRHNHTGEAFVVEKRRIRGTFLENLELNEFPFDIQDLTVTLMSDRPASEIDFYENPNDLHRVNRQSFIDEQEWILYKYVETDLKEVCYEYENPSVTRSALKVKCRAARRPAYFFWNIFLITFLICSLSFVTFAVEYSLPQNRLQLTFTLVLTSVAFKFVVNQSLPKISYLTYLDKYVLLAMIMLTLVCIWHGVTTIFVYYEVKNITLYDMAALSTFASLYFLFNVVFLLGIYIKPYRARKKMQILEKEYTERTDAQVHRQSKRDQFLRRNSLFSVTAI